MRVLPVLGTPYLHYVVMPSPILSMKNTEGCPADLRPAPVGGLGVDHHLPLAELVSAHLKPAHVAGLAPSLHEGEEGVRPGAV